MADDSDLIRRTFAGWVRVSDAIARFDVQYDTDAKQHILLRLQFGGLRALAESVFIDEKTESRGYCPIPPGHWRGFDNDLYLSAFWRTGNLDIKIFYEAIAKWVTNHFIEIRFNPDDFAKIPGVKVEAPPQPSPTVAGELPSPNAGGRPKAECWEDLWIEMCRQIMSGDLKFEKNRRCRALNARLPWRD